MFLTTDNTDNTDKEKRHDGNPIRDIRVIRGQIFL
jgi:hypothetical protein